MTQKEFEDARAEIQYEYFRQMHDIEHKRIATMNTQGVAAGDIIEADGIVIKVADIKYVHALPGGNEYLRFRGNEYNRQLKRTRNKEMVEVFWRVGQPLDILKKRQKG